MKRHKNLIKLSKDHHDGLILAQLIKKNSPPYKGLPTTTEGKKEYTLNFYNLDLIKHFEAEEKILMPLVKGIDNELDRLLQLMISEHEQVYKLIDDLKLGNEVEDTLDKLGNLLEKHIRMEERELFDRIQNLCNDDILNQIQL